MQITDTARFQQIVEAAKAKAAGSRRCVAAIEKAADAIINNKWVITPLADCYAITTESGKTYYANGKCQCEAYRYDQPCKHRCAARLLDLYFETSDQTRASLIAAIEQTWSAKFPDLHLADALMARFGKNQLDMLDDDMLRRVRLAIAA